MYFKEAIRKRVLELCNKYNYTPNRLAELSAIPPSTLRAILTNKVDNPSSLIIYKICKTLNMEIKDFFNSDIFKEDFDDWKYILLSFNQLLNYYEFYL